MESRLSLSEQLQQTFELASWRYQASKLPTPADLEKGNAIRNRYAKAVQKEERLYVSEYHNRVETKLKELIDKAGAKERSFKHRWFGSDNFNRDDLTRKAHQQVRMGHQQRLWKLAESEGQELKILMDNIEQREQKRGIAREDFGRTTDRRSGEERRKPSTRPIPRRQR